MRITWDITIFTDKRMKHNRPDITVVHKDTQEWMIINIAAPADQNILTTGEEKYQNLALEIKRILRAKRVTVLAIVTGALRTISGYTKAGNGRLSLPDIFGSAQLSAILGTAHILRKVSCVSAAGLLLRIHRKRTEEDNTIIMIIIIVIIIIIIIRRRRRRRRRASLFRIELS